MTTPALKIAFISDVHAAAEPYEAALSAARAEGFDRLVILGDLLTYGPDPERSLELTRSAVRDHDAILILGNHDAMYRSAEGYGSQLPDWIQESVNWTRARIGDDRLDDLPWQDRWTLDDLLVSHANPYPPGDWSYLRTREDFAKAAQALVDQGFRFGVFGHVHRFVEYHNGEVSLFTIGSVGQPRDRQDSRPQWAMATLEQHSFRLSPRPLAYDWDEHCRRIQAADMSEATIEQLCRFYP